MLKDKIEKILPLVQKPARYTGGELNSVVKNKKNTDIRFAFCFPDTYEIGMSHLGMKILYSLINSRENYWCERVFAPDVDMEEVMRENDIPLFALESRDALADFDVVGFTIQYELCYTNILNMLNLAKIPLKSYERGDSLDIPIIIAGGPCVCNPEPLADFIDAFQIGEGEEMMLEFLDLLNECKKNHTSRKEFLKQASQIKGIYVPSLYNVEYNSDGTIKKVTPIEGAPEKVDKRVVADLDNIFYPDKFVVPFVEVVHDRVVHEIFRGCIRGCRFCQAGFWYRPIREKNVDTISKQSRKLACTTGYDELSLCSLSSSDYTKITELLEVLLGWATPQKINIALPSLRIDNFSDELKEKLALVRRSGLTFAAEAGTQRMRDVINKNITESEILTTCRKAFVGGWTAVKLYFMIGLPTETDEDVIGINELSQKVVEEFYSNPDKPKGKGVSVSAGVSSFVPKPCTPFQWEPQDTVDELKRKQQLLLATCTSKKITFRFHNVNLTYLEGIFARGDRRLGKVIETAYNKGCTFDSWDDKFNFDAWMEAFDECNSDKAFYANRRRDYDEILPWDHINSGIKKSFLINENEKAKAAQTTPHCRQNCAACGSNSLNGGKCHALNKNLV
ncbi:MAG: TIGR03960 family B12-binding radical SAM protein [Ruminococcaceae bacterium]|nr:TIGR03960 family B12-binding radical SAM protein [Oscillospiraceae bacterium]